MPRAFAGALFILAAAVFAVGPPAGAASERLSVRIELDLFGRDSLLVCQPTPFREQAGQPTPRDRAIGAANAVAAAIGRIDAEPAYDPASPRCASATFPQPLAAGPSGGNVPESGFALDTHELISTASALGYAGVDLDVCAPSGAEIQVRDGPQPAPARGCDGAGARWTSAVSFVVQFTGLPGQVEPTGDEPVRGSGSLHITIDLRAALNDGVLACRDEPFAGDEVALAFGRFIADSLGLAGAGIEFDSFIDDTCVDIMPVVTLTRPGNGEHARTYELDGTAMLERATAAGYETVYIDICVPVLPVRFSEPEQVENYCEYRGAGYEGAARVAVTFSAGDAEVDRGVGAGVSALLSAFVLAGIAFVRGGRTARWLWFRRHIVATVVFTGAVTIGSVIGWLGLAYASGLVHALQLARGIGVGGELVLLGTPSFLFAGITIGGAVYSRHVLGKAFPRAYLRAASGLIAPLRTDAGRPGAKARVLAVLPRMVAYVTAVVLIVAVEAPRGKIVALLLLAIVVALALPPLTKALVPLAASSVRMNADREAALLAELGAFGTDVREIWVTPRPVFVPAPLPFAGVVVRPGAILGKRAVVWEAVSTVPPRILAGGLATRTRAMPGPLLGAVLIEVAQGFQEFPQDSVSWWFFALAGLAVVIPSAVRLVRSTRTRRRLASSGSAVEVHEGMLLFGRIEARLLASRGPVRLLSLGRRHWRRTLDRADGYARSAGLPPETVVTAAERVIAIESARFAGVVEQRRVF